MENMVHFQTKKWLPGGVDILNLKTGLPFGNGLHRATACQTARGAWVSSGWLLCSRGRLPLDEASGRKLLDEASGRKLLDEASGRKQEMQQGVEQEHGEKG